MPASPLQILKQRGRAGSSPCQTLAFINETVVEISTAKPSYAGLLKQHFLYFLPLPHGHGSFLPVFGVGFPIREEAADEFRLAFAVAWAVSFPPRCLFSRKHAHHPISATVSSTRRRWGLSASLARMGIITQRLKVHENTTFCVPGMECAPLTIRPMILEVLRPIRNVAKYDTCSDESISGFASYLPQSRCNRVPSSTAYSKSIARVASIPTKRDVSLSHSQYRTLGYRRLRSSTKRVD
jgi:hypothetical protein